MSSAQEQGSAAETLASVDYNAPLIYNLCTVPGVANTAITNPFHSANTPNHESPLLFVKLPGHALNVSGIPLARGWKLITDQIGSALLSARLFYDSVEIDSIIAGYRERRGITASVANTTISKFPPFDEEKIYVVWQGMATRSPKRRTRLTANNWDRLLPLILTDGSASYIEIYPRSDLVGGEEVEQEGEVTTNRAPEAGEGDGENEGEEGKEGKGDGEGRSAEAKRRRNRRKHEKNKAKKQKAAKAVEAVEAVEEVEEAEGVEAAEVAEAAEVVAEPTPTIPPSRRFNFSRLTVQDVLDEGYWVPGLTDPPRAVEQEVAAYAARYGRECRERRLRLVRSSPDFFETF